MADNNNLTKVEEQWLAMGKKIAGDYSLEVANYMDMLLQSNRMEEFMDYYFKLLPYIKPKIQALAVKQESKIILQFGDGDKQIINNI